MGVRSEIGNTGLKCAEGRSRTGHSHYENNEISKWLV